MSSSALIGSLDIVTRLDTAQFSKGVDAITSKLSSAVSSVAKFATSFTGLTSAAALAGAAITSAISGLGKLDELANSAVKLGVGVDSLTRLSVAAELSDVSTESLTSSWTKLLRNIGELQSGSKTAVANFAAIGLTLDDIKGKSSDEQFIIVAEALSKIEDPAERISKGMDVFGKSFADLIPLIDKGGSGIEKLSKQADALGQILDENQTKRVEESNEALDRLGVAADGASMQLAASLSPAIEGLAEIGITLLTDVLKPIIPILTAIATVVGITAKIIASAFSGIWFAMQLVATALYKIGGVFSSTMAAMADESEKSLNETGNRLKEIWSDTDNLSNVTKGYGDIAETAYNRAGNAAKSAAESQQELLEKSIKTTEDLTKQRQFDIRTFGMSSSAKQIQALRDADTDRTNMQKYRIDDLEELDKKLAKLEEEKKLRADTQKLIADGLEWTRKTQADIAAAARKYDRELIENHKRRIEEEKKENEDRIKRLKESAKTDSMRKTEQTIEAARALNAGEITPEEYGRIRQNIEGDRTEAMPQRNPLPFAGAATFGSAAAEESILRMSARGNTDPWKLMASKEDRVIEELRELNRETKKQKNEKTVSIR